MLNVSQLLYRSAGDGCFHSQLAINISDRAALLVARTLVRDHLRKGIAELTQQVLGQEKRVTPK